MKKLSVDMSAKQHYKNIIINIISFCVQFAINFYISPIIVGKVGASAYGFIGLANDFVSYVSIIAAIFNSVASRFIAEAFYKKDYVTANKYFNSLIIANVLISLFLTIGNGVFIYNLEYIIKVPKYLLFDVKLSFALIFLSYIVSLLTLVFTTATFVTNRTDIQGIRNIIQYLVRFALIIILLKFVSVRIYWVAFATLVSCIVVAGINFNLTRRLTPELQITFRGASIKYVLQLGKAGCWMALMSISTVLLRGLDLIVANIFIGEYEMGLLSIARTFPNNFSTAINIIAPLFTPLFIAFYAKNEIQGLMKSVKKSINDMALVIFVPVTCFIVYSYDFYLLWQNSLSIEEVKIITTLSTIAIVQLFFEAVTAPMAQISVVVNQLKLPVIVSLGCGIISILAELIMIKFSNLGIYSIVLSTTFVMIIRYVFFNAIYAAKCLNQSAKSFFVPSIKTWISIPILFGIIYFPKFFLKLSTWKELIMAVVISVFIGYIFMFALYGRKRLKNIFIKGGIK